MGPDFGIAYLALGWFISSLFIYFPVAVICSILVGEKRVVYCHSPFRTRYVAVGVYKQPLSLSKRRPLVPDSHPIEGTFVILYVNEPAGLPVLTPKFCLTYQVELYMA